MRPLFLRLFLIIILSFGLFSYAFPWTSYDIEVPFSGKDYKLGLDLQGGIELDYKVDLEIVRQEEDYSAEREKSIIEGLKSIIDKRVQSLKINDSIISSANYGGEQHIIVQIPLKGNDSFQNQENIEQAKEAIGRVVKIEFKEQRTEITDQDLAERKALAEKAFGELETSSFSLVAQKYAQNNVKVFFGKISASAEEITEKYFNAEALFNTEEAFMVEGELGQQVVTHSTGASIEDFGKGYFIVETFEKTSDKNYNFEYVFISEQPGDWIAAKDTQGRILNDKYFENASVTQNEAFQPLIQIVFNNEGADIFGELTKRLVGKQMAIFVGGENLTAPIINEPIFGGSAVISGDYTFESAKELAENINTGVVPAPIYLTSERTIDSRLGQNSLQKLIVAGLSGFVVIFLFLIVVYRGAGLIASGALLLYVLLVLTVIKMFGVVLTLASIAGLILSIGMAIDANILIFERLRDELRSDKGLIHATRIGFEESWTAIWDSNLTGLIIAIILFVFGINLIKGFGLMLAIGIVVSLFSVYFISKVMLMLLAKTNISQKMFIRK